MRLSPGVGWVCGCRSAPGARGVATTPLLTEAAPCPPSHRRAKAVLVRVVPFGVQAVASFATYTGGLAAVQVRTWQRARAHKPR